jgi:hypothetical protein
LAELDDIATNFNTFLVKSEIRDKAGVDAETLAKTGVLGFKRQKKRA